MQENLAVSARGQITLPAAIRKHFGIHPGDIVILQDRDGEIVLKPAAVLEIDTYTDEQIAHWDEQDRLAPEERKAILERLGAATRMTLVRPAGTAPPPALCGHP
jgi:AbrB family looped-hinge helix DNA binding protein